ncbi:MAG: hypothetical protein DI538_03745 [Azospira oryzae]|jgi:hypothetical protein|nr:MAG: hypothetical protein DI538_03745 [Azospira oryzae]
MIWLKRIIHLLLALMFFAFAGLQFNDPDPLLWIAIYSAMTVLCALAAFGKYYFKVMLVLAAGYLVYMVILYPGLVDWLRSSDRSLLFDDIAKMQYPFIEESREFLGLLICEVVLVVYILVARKK